MFDGASPKQMKYRSEDVELPRGRKKVEPEPIKVIDEPIVEVVDDPEIIDVESEGGGSKLRKPYPTHEERIRMADEQIQHWESLNARRRKLVAATEKTLEDRKSALAKGEAEIQRLIDWKQRLAEIKDGMPSTTRTHTRQKYNELMNALKVSGRSMDDLLYQLKGESQGARS
ncbi:MAG: hypothetical protein LBB86_09070 [Oscillospiraceae bacterium]|nr:hypothetical protein [Oscillospiraceae bacterium]